MTQGDALCDKCLAVLEGSETLYFKGKNVNFRSWALGRPVRCEGTA